jgi:hypothetical protein
LSRRSFSHAFSGGFDVIQLPIEILKSLWSRRADGSWSVTSLKGLNLKPKPGFETDYFTFERDVELLAQTPSQNIHEVFASFGKGLSR